MINCIIIIRHLSNNVRKFILISYFLSRYINTQTKKYYDRVYNCTHISQEHYTETLNVKEMKICQQWKLHPKVCRLGRLNLPLLLHMTCAVKRENVITLDNIVLLKCHDSKDYIIYYLSLY